MSKELQAAALAVSGAGGDEVFDELVRLLADILGVDAAMISIFAGEERTRMRTLATWLDAKLLRGFEYDIAGSPCAGLVGRQFRYVGSAGRAAFAPDTIFHAKGMDSYAAFALTAPDGVQLGLIAVMDRDPLPERTLVEAMLKIFAMRAVAELERAERRANEEQYRAIFNATADALVLRDAQFRVVDVNHAYEALSGYSRAEALGKDRVLANPAVEPEVRGMHRRALAGEPAAIETVRLLRDGTRVEVELRAVPISHRGEPHVLFIGRDISARKRAEAQREALQAQLRQAQKMEALGQLTGGIAHDFNNLLASIMGYVVLASERVAGGDAKLHGYLEEALLSCRRARDLIQQMLTFSRGQRGSPQPLRLGEAVEDSLKLVRSSLPSTVEVRAAAPGAAAVVLLDPVQLDQVLLNLSINARDAMGGSGAIDVRVELAHGVDAQCSSCRQAFRGEFAELSVADGGRGIPAEALEHVFEPFFSTKEVGRGSGMGLATVHGIVHEHHGHILVESGPAGSRFRVLLPLASGPGVPAQRAPAPPAQPPRRALSGRVLVVDDERPVAEFMRELLQGWGLQAVAHTSAEQALDEVARDPRAFDLVITDQSMPGLTGVGLARRIGALRRGLPVVLYSGHVDKVTERESAGAGIRAMLDKPVEPDRLYAVLKSFLD